MTELMTTDDIQSRMLMVRGNPSLLDRDVAALYGLETKAINQAVRNNPAKFPIGYVIELSNEETEALRSKIFTLESQGGKGHYSKHGYKAFTEKGVYMLATILKGERAVKTTIKIIETYTQLRSMVADEEVRSMGELIPIDVRTRQFAIRIVKLYQYLTEKRHEKVLSEQVLRSGTSIGANVAEGLFGASHSDFINKYTIALKEANETHYWLTLLKETDYLPTGDATESILSECNQIISILAASVKTAKLRGGK